MRLPDEVLTRYGVSLQGVLPATELVDSHLSDRYASIIVLAHGGSDYWRHIESDKNDPIDELATKLSHDLMQRNSIERYELLYPSSEYRLDLRAIGRKLGWHHDSKLGIGIHPEYGTWFAYRAVIAVEDALSVTGVEQSDFPCGTCKTQDCIASCPSGAIGAIEFDLNACVNYRLAPESLCVDRCLARQACPVGVDHAYSQAQVNYHYRRSWNTIKTLSEQNE